MNALRGTGRTTRMLGHALDLVREGRSVVVVGVDGPHLGLLAERMERIAGKLVDHYAIENHFARALNEMHRWDAPIEAARR